MKSVYSITAKKTMAAPGEWAYDAEAKVCGTDSADEVFVHVNWYDGFKSYTVGKESLMEMLGLDKDADELEEADELPAIGTEEFLHDLTTMSLEDYCKKYGVSADDSGESNHMESYEKLSAAKQSVYYPVFKALDSVLKAMDTEIDG